MLYTWESVKSFHFIIHRSGMSKGIADGLRWNQANNYLESLQLIWKLAIVKTHTAGPKRGGDLSTNQWYQPYLQTMAIQPTLCYCYNVRVNCNGNVCKFEHVCMYYTGLHMGH